MFSIILRVQNNFLPGFYVFNYTLKTVRICIKNSLQDTNKVYAILAPMYGFVRVPLIYERRRKLALPVANRAASSKRGRSEGQRVEKEE